MDAVIGGIGYRDLRDHSLGPLISDALAREDLPGVEVHDLSYNAVAVGQWLQDLAPESRPSRLVLVSAVPRGREVGAVVAYRWDAVLPSVVRIQEAVADAVTGVIHLDNTLIVLAQFGPLPAEVIVVEVEPGVEAFGSELSPGLEQEVGRLEALVSRLAVDGSDGLPTLGLGGPPPTSVGPGPASDPKSVGNGTPRRIERRL